MARISLVYMEDFQITPSMHPNIGIFPARDQTDRDGYPSKQTVIQDRDTGKYMF